MSLDSGVWCFVVYGNTGSGSYSLRVQQSCSNPTPRPTPYPTITPAPCGVYKSDSRDGFLYQGQAVVYGYSIPSDSRSKIDWTMTSSGSPQGGDTPVIIASAGNPTVDRSSSSGGSTFDLYVFKDCNPKKLRCSTRYYSYGPNSHITIPSPSTGSIYYVMIYARTGSGNFHLKMNSYKCTSGDDPIIMASAGGATMASASADSTVLESDVSSPIADFITIEGTG